MLEEKSWKIGRCLYDGQTFYFKIGYLASKERFFFGVFLPENREAASRYKTMLPSMTQLFL